MLYGQDTLNVTNMPGISFITHSHANKSKHNIKDYWMQDDV